MVVEWPFKKNGVDRIYTALVKVGFCHVNESHISVNMGNAHEEYDIIGTLQCEK